MNDALAAKTDAVALVADSQAQALGARDWLGRYQSGVLPAIVRGLVDRGELVHWLDGGQTTSSMLGLRRVALIEDTDIERGLARVERLVRPRSAVVSRQTEQVGYRQAGAQETLDSVADGRGSSLRPSLCATGFVTYEGGAQALLGPRGAPGGPQYRRSSSEGRVRSDRVPALHVVVFDLWLEVTICSPSDSESTESVSVNSSGIAAATSLSLGDHISVDLWLCGAARLTRGEADSTWTAVVDERSGVQGREARGLEAAERAGQGWLVNLLLSRTARSHPSTPGSEPAAAGSWPFEPLAPALAPAQFRQRVSRALEFIAAGEAYQLNISQRFSAPYRSEMRADNGGFALQGQARGHRGEMQRARLVLDAYLVLRAGAGASMGAIIDSTHGTLISNSPETLWRIGLRPAHDSTLAEAEVLSAGRGWMTRASSRAGMPDLTPNPEHARAETWRIESCPIKGTRPRALDAAVDEELAQELRASTKDAAEHLMIVDLVRNDLTRIAAVGSVRAPRQSRLVSLPTVHHLVSTVSARLESEWQIADVARALFPGGSITGAPKRRAVELIADIEGEARGIYCGGVLRWTATQCELSITIRSGWIDDDGLVVRSGGGVVADSEPEREREETLHKLSAFLRAQRAGRGDTEGSGDP